MYLYIQYIYLHFSPQPLQLKRSRANPSRRQHQVSRYRPGFYAATGVQDFLCVGVVGKNVVGSRFSPGMDVFMIHNMCIYIYIYIFIVPTICSQCVCVCVIEFRCFVDVHMALTCMSFTTCANSSISLAPLALCEGLLSESNRDTGQNHESSWLLTPSYLPKSNLLWCEMMWNDVRVWTFLWCHMMSLYQLSNSWLSPPWRTFSAPILWGLSSCLSMRPEMLEIECGATEGCSTRNVEQFKSFIQPHSTTAL